MQNRQKDFLYPRLDEEVELNNALDDLLKKIDINQ